MRRQGLTNRYGAVLIIALAVAVLSLLLPDSPGARAAELAMMGGSLLAAAATAGHRLRSRSTAVTIGVVVLVGAVLAAARIPPPALVLGATGLLAVATIAIVAVGIARLIRDRGVVLPVVFGALAVYLLLGLAFSFGIGALAAGGSGPYFATGTDGTQADRVYFSFATLTTTGYGDFTAGERFGRAVAVLEMLVGQLYLVTVISLLVGNLRRRQEQ